VASNARSLRRCSCTRFGWGWLPIQVLAHVCRNICEPIRTVVHGGCALSPLLFFRVCFIFDHASNSSPQMKLRNDKRIQQLPLIAALSSETRRFIHQPRRTSTRPCPSPSPLRRTGGGVEPGSAQGSGSSPRRCRLCVPSPPAVTRAFPPGAAP